MAEMPKILHTKTKVSLDHYLMFDIEWPALSKIEVFSIIKSEGIKTTKTGSTITYDIQHEIIYLN